jgi:hypothetical protein
MEGILGFAIEGMVALLLSATIVYCAVLDRRLKRLRADEGAMRQTIGELVAATHAAERSIIALRATVGACEETLSERLGRAQALSLEMAGQLGAGEEVIERITRIAKAARDHTHRLSERVEIEKLDVEREAARQEARAAAERAEAIRAISPSLATAAAAEMFSTRIRALSLGSAA